MLESFHPGCRSQACSQFIIDEGQVLSVGEVGIRDPMSCTLLGPQAEDGHQ